MAPEDLVRLDENARTGWPWSGTPWNSLSTERADLQEGTGLVAALASMHPDGRVRQRAAAALAQRPGPLAARLLALRCVDHVVQVRDEASAGLHAHSSVADARHVLAVLLAVAGRAQGSTALVGYTDALLARQGGPAVLLQLLDVPNRRSRRWAFHACLDEGLLTAADLLAATEDRHDQFIRRAAAEYLADHRDTVGPAPLQALLAGRYADGRTAALVALSDDELPDDDLRAALLDRSPRVRDTARWRARRRGMDVAGFYRAALNETDHPRTAVACLTGLMWVGDRGDLPTIERRLDDASPSVRAAAVQALITRTGPDEVAERLGPLLLDASPRVASVAVRALAQAGAAATRDSERAAWASAQPWSRRAGWRLGRLRGGWDRVEVDLRAVADPELSELGRAGLREWLRNSAATTWNRSEGARAERFTALLADAGLDEESNRLIAFHAGLPTRPAPEPATRSADPASIGDDVRRGWWHRLWPPSRPEA
jgi:HEAT repeat protein